MTITLRQMNALALLDTPAVVAGASRRRTADPMLVDAPAEAV